MVRRFLRLISAAVNTERVRGMLLAGLLVSLLCGNCSGYKQFYEIASIRPGATGNPFNATGVFSVYDTLGGYPVNVIGQAATTRNGNVYFVGGGELNVSLQSYFYEYQPLSRSFQRLIDLTAPKFFSCAASDGTYVYALGGSVANDQSARTSMVERYDFSTGTWQARSGMTAQLDSFGCYASANEIYTVGGSQGGAGTYVKTLQFEAVPADTWNILPPVTTPGTSAPGMVLGACGTSLYAFGGTQCCYNRMSAIYKYNGSWTPIGAAVSGGGTDSMGVLSHNNKIYLVGGQDISSNPSKNAFIFDCVTETLTAMPTLINGRIAPGLVIVGNTLVVAGGYTTPYAGGQIATAVEVIDTSGF